MNTTILKKPRGRPTNFDYDEALEKALQVFWAHGYEGASMAELTEALGINKPSIYAAFGNKEELFNKALDKYLSGPLSYISDAMGQPTARKSVETFLTKSAALLTNPNNPRGCMVVQGALTCGQGSNTIQQKLIAYRSNLENSFDKRFQLAKAQGELSPDVNTKQLAKYIATIHQGMSVQATSGASKEELFAVIQQALTNWPINP
jgi:AcrR family transcriptional regulator